MSRLAAEVEERFIRLRTQEADARPTQAIGIDQAVIDALAAPRFPGINIENAVTAALQVAGAGFAETLAIYEKATLPVVHDEFRIALAGPVDARLLIAAPRAILERAAARFRNAFLAAFLFAIGTALLLALLAGFSLTAPEQSEQSEQAEQAEQAERATESEPTQESRQRAARTRLCESA